LKGITSYQAFTQKILSKKIVKSKKVFDDAKITDHHAIIPTGVNPPSSLHIDEKKVYDAITRRFLAAFYPDCLVSNTTVIGFAGDTEFKANGKVILEPGWRELYPKKQIADDNEQDEQIMPVFEVGEKGVHL
ncbi:MAG: DNA topoisomerase III, partial [Bacteroidales bacterium]|nr:DNA topoisomerase III [Bacteroidales bacterium]